MAMWWKIILIALGSIIILLTSSVTIGSLMFKRRVNSDIDKLFEKSADSESGIITERDLEGLPEPVQRYLRYTQVVGKEKTGVVRLKQKGYFRQEPGQPWMPFEAEQYYTTDPPGFVWTARLKAFPLLSIKGRDMYYEGKGNMLIKLPPFITIADAWGPEMDQGALSR